MRYRIVYLILSIMFLITTISLVITYRKSLFSDVNINGATIIDFRVTNEVNTDNLKDIIQKITNINNENIKINQKGEILTITFRYVENETEEIIDTFHKEFGNYLAFKGYSSIENLTTYYVMYIIYIAISLFVLLNTGLIIKNSISIYKNSKITVIS
ncbi:hypothetical protein [Lachnoclostridium phytofermentans]|uniref:Uncharacterized protein n=1 Tax=Lachnoclostridium phytofermentans (strain ATCC 700394 / DSM 18823 / ISDg) TaxID=357809 RepID=A9KMA8_LACP7|nr:hypothetical protein [Lachnoclostridium phytofermentans]ABX42862.1 hypothetical protein Cphy_2501 [Lachnoclostridium phytofermentans ISDg]